MTRYLRAAVITCACAALGVVPITAQTRDRRPPSTDQARERRPDDGQARSRPREAPRPTPRPAPGVTRRGVVVFVGGYFYDPYYGPYPWWPHPPYPVWYHPRFDSRAEVRIDCREKGAAVYVDGYYAGIVDDFDGFFQRLPLPPGGHRLTLFLEGFETADYRVYLRPGVTFTLHHLMARSAPGVASRRPEVAPPVPAPPEGTYTAPAGQPPVAPDPTAAPRTASEAIGTLDLRVQPASAEVRVDGERWLTSGDGAYELLLPAGRHRLDVTAPGYRPYGSDVDVRTGETMPLRVSLTREPTS